MPDRAQTETVGAILVVGLVVVSVGVAGAYAMGTVTQSTETPDAAVTDQIDADGITLSHQGGDSLPSDDLRLIVAVNGSETGLAWDDGMLSGGDDAFDPGEGWTASENYDPGSVVTVRLVDEPTNTVLFRTETTVTAQEPVESDIGGQIDAVDSEGEIRQGDISTPQSPDGSNDQEDDECEYEEKEGDEDEEDEEDEDEEDEEDEDEEDGECEEEDEKEDDEEDEEEEDDSPGPPNGAGPP